MTGDLQQLTGWPRCSQHCPHRSHASSHSNMQICSFQIIPGWKLLKGLTWPLDEVLMKFKLLNMIYKVLYNLAQAYFPGHLLSSPWHLSSSHNEFLLISLTLHVLLPPGICSFCWISLQSSPHCCATCPCTPSSVLSCLLERWYPVFVWVRSLSVSSCHILIFCHSTCFTLLFLPLISLGHQWNRSMGQQVLPLIPFV